MIKNYIKSAKRNILKNKGVYGINIIGLSLGLASCLLILLFILDEISYDRYNQKADDIVRIVFKAEIGGEEISEAVVMPPVGPTLENEFPEVVTAARLKQMNDPSLSYNNKIYRDFDFAYIDPEFLEVFDLKIIDGNNTNPLEDPNAVILTKKQAKRYFGTENPIGKRLNFEIWDKQFTVTAVIEEIPENSHFEFGMFASMNGYEYANSTSWVNSDFHTYLLLKDGAQFKNLEAKLPGIMDKYMGPQIREAVGVSYSEFKDKNRVGLFLQPLTDIHLNPDFVSSGHLKPGMDIKYLYIFGAVAIFMLFIACINFMNLATAAASKRAKEVGIRKVLGSGQKQLIKQFLTESFLATLIAAILAILLVVFFLPTFNDLAGKSLQVIDLLQFPIVLSTLALIVLVAFLAGGYPAFFLSSFKPIQVLKSRFSASGKSNFRNGLVVFQFIISAGLILATIVVYQQMAFIQNKDLGYNKDHILVLRDAQLLGEQSDAFKNQILDDSRVKSVSNSSFLPAGATDINMSGILLDDEYQRRMFIYNVDEAYIPTLGLELVAGRNFSKEFGAEEHKVIINETAANSLGFHQDPIGKTFTKDTDEGGRELTIVGVVKDFHFKSLHREIEPLILMNNPYGGLIVRTNTADVASLLSNIESEWQKFSLKEPFSYTFLDESFNKTYLREQKMGTILSIFTGLTIFVACMGLFGLVTFAAERRVREIGIRKVLGSSVPEIISLLSKDFIKLILISFIIAFPLGYFLMEQWLQDFAYRIQIKWWVFLLAGFLTTLIALITIGFKSYKAASANPIKSLRTE
ncbi:ABC transporter permease [Salegentibacter salegens]|uniref:Putative ABC transport system permease protein n=1 Tax=Salegentibacter salegens TaxID=143223 RepID=A0A1M7LL90_9FLAO|nr:ABC transporter permease [Salegentibacter salegens]PRX43044.1 putative ABC transport system permease protein [Salegentibacter salegens]SHM78905.1 putative ABC transport system permease protein [Salegentibacter salegens]